MIVFFTAIALVIAAVAVVVLRTLREKRARVERFGPSPTPRRPETAGTAGRVSRWR